MCVCVCVFVCVCVCVCAHACMCARALCDASLFIVQEEYFSKLADKYKQLHAEIGRSKCSRVNCTVTVEPHTV